MRGRLHFLYALASALSLTANVSSFAQSADPVELTSRARALSLEGQQDEALALYREVLTRTPDSFEANYGAGVASDLKGAYPDARRFFTKAIQLAPEEKKVQALTGIAISYAFDRDASNAARFWQQAFDRQTTASEYAGAADTANALGAVYLESGDAENALKWYQTAYETARREPNLPGDQLAMYDLRWAHAQARIAARKGKAAEARKQAAMVKALVEKGTSPEQEIEYLFLLGYVDFYLKNYREAIAELRKADQSDPVVLVLLAQAYEKTRDRASARELYGKVMTSNMHSVNNAFARPLARRKVAARQ